MTVINNPLYEGPKLAVEIATLEDASRIAGSVFKVARESNPYSKLDVQSSAYDLSRSSEKAQVFIKENKINPSASGGPEFNPLPQLTVDVGPFNKNQRYFSDPGLDVPSERQFSLAGTEAKPPLNKPGVLPLTEVTVTPFESNPLSISVKKGGESRLTPFEYAGYLQEKYPKFDGVGFDVQSRNALGTTGENALGHTGVDIDIKLLDQPAVVQTFSKEMAKIYKKTQGENLNSLIGTKYVENADTVLAHELVHAESRLQGKFGTEKEAFLIMKDNPEFLVDKPTVVRGSSTVQSRVIDLPVAKSFNKDTLQGTPVVDLMNPDRSSFISQDLKQSTLAPIENKVSSVPKGSQKPLIYEKVKPVENKPVIDNSFAFESGGSVVVAESGSAPASLPARSFGSERVLKVNAEYVFDSSSGEYVRKVGDVELNLDIKGKVTPQKFGGSGSISLLNPQSKNLDSPKLINVQSQNLFHDNKQNTGLDQGSVQSQNPIVDQGSDSKSASKMVLIQGSAQSQGLSQTSEQSMRSMIVFKPNQVQKLSDSTFSSYDRTDKITPLKPKFLSSPKQKPSGSGSFSVLVRKGGKFQLLGSGYSDLVTAFNRGKQEVKNTARASFKVVNNFGGSVGLNVKGNKTLYSSKKESNVVIQKNKFRISSSGEVNEISRKGQASQRKKRMGVFG
jgi:hypothetical protein